jgi:solute carrier family 8 (sodium/calcium exchanger)
LLTLKASCTICGKTRVWDNESKGAMTGNVILAAAIYFSGTPFSKIAKVCESVNLNIFGETLFYKIVKQLLQPAIYTCWSREQEKLLSSDAPLVLAGDMRADSPGHCAKFGSYTVLDVQQNKIVHTELVQVIKNGNLNSILYFHYAVASIK